MPVSERHKTERKGLFVQIRYLKARYNREVEFRNDLVHQKQYLGPCPFVTVPTKVCFDIPALDTRAQQIKASNVYWLSSHKWSDQSVDVQ